MPSLAAAAHHRATAPLTAHTLAPLTAPSQIAGGQKYRPPAADVNAPDLFVPVMAAWTYALLNCALLAARGAFRPEALSNLVRAAAGAGL